MGEHEVITLVPGAGGELSLTTTFALAVHPNASVPRTLYVIGPEGKDGWSTTVVVLPPIEPIPFDQAKLNWFEILTWALNVTIGLFVVAVPVPV